jgi:hypothetical protein
VPEAPTRIALSAVLRVIALGIGLGFTGKRMGLD